MDSRARKKKLSKSKRVAHDEDKISKLPDLILGRILSFLSAKEAVRTCVLSTRWIHAWRFITNIHLDDRWINSKTVKKNEHFANVVNRLINLNDNPNIESFSLLISSDNKYEPPQVNAWIAGISGKSIQKLHIKYTAEEVFPSFFSLFNCRTLVHMVLDMNCSLRVPISICLPNLLSLKLRKVVFLREFSTHSTDIIFSFPVLKVFEAHDCEWFQNVCIQAPQLEIISLKNTMWVSHKSTIKISASHIECFYLYGDLLNHDIIIVDPSSVVNCFAGIYIYDDYSEPKMQELGLRACVFLKQFCEVEDLKLGTGTAQVLAKAKDCFEAMVPRFRRLINLRLEGFTVEILLAFLRKSQFLETLVLKSVEPFDEGLLSSAIIPPSLRSSLEVALLLEFKGDEHEICLAKYFLDNAAYLEEMVISTYWMWDSDTKLEELKEQILAYPKLSSNADVDFIINVRGDFSMETSAYGNSTLKEALGLF